MRKVYVRGGLIGIALALCCSPEAMAAMLDSTLFNHKYEGNTVTPSEISEYHTVTAPGDGSWSTDGDILTTKNSIVNSGGLMLSNWLTLDPNPVSNANGWTTEFRIRIGTDGDPGPNGAFQLLAKDVAGTNSQGRSVALNLRADSTTLLAVSTPLISNTSNSDGFHVFRVAQDPNSSQTRIWKDNDLIFEGLSRTSNDSGSGNGSLVRMFWGDGSGNVGGPSVYLDYFRWDSTGAYEPVPIPEPVGLLLLGIGSLGVAGCWHRRHRRSRNQQ